MLPEITANTSEVTSILNEVKQGADKAYRKLFPLVYSRLKDIAKMRIMREYNEHTYSDTDLVHEAYLELINIEGIDWQDRSHFYAISSRCMRRILVDHARKKKAEKRGGDNSPLPYREGDVQVEEQTNEIINLDEALNKLASLNERLAKVVEYRYFGEMSIEDTAHALDISISTVKRDWIKARGWLYKELKDRF